MPDTPTKTDALYKLEVPHWRAIELLREQEPARAQVFVQAVTTDPLKYYCPTGVQEEYIDTVAHSTKHTKIPVVALTAANGIGKSESTLHVLYNLIYGPQNGWFDYPLFHHFPFPKRIWYVSTVDNLKERVIPGLQALAPNAFALDLVPELDPIQAKKEGKTWVAKMEFANGWTIHMKTFDMDVKMFESSNVGVIVNDEPCPEPIWKAEKSRRRKGCLMLLPMTPLNTPPYLVDEIQQHVEQTAETGKPSGYFRIKADVYSACKQRGVRGYLEPDIVDDMVADYDEEEVQARAYGEFTYFSGRIYRHYNEESQHFVEPSAYPVPRYSRLFQGVDPHDGRPSAVLWAALTPPVENDNRGRWIIFKEYPEVTLRHFWNFDQGVDAGEEVEAFLEIEEWIRNHVVNTERIWRIMDRYYGWQTRKTEDGTTNLATMYLQEGNQHYQNPWPFIYLRSYTSSSADGEIAFGHQQVRQALKPLNDGKPGLVIWDTCHYLHDSLRHYIKEQQTTTKQMETKSKSQARIVEKYKDYPDVLRYLVCSQLGEPEEEEAPLSARERRFKEQWEEVTTPGSGYKQGNELRYQTR